MKIQFNNHPSDEYLRWLLGDIFRDAKSLQYAELALILYQIPYRWVHQMDEGRALDGLYLRRRFLNEREILEGSPEYLAMGFPGFCSVLEMMVMFSIRMDLEVYSLGENDRPDLIFWEMLKNLGVLEIPENSKTTYFRHKYVDFVGNRINQWLDNRIGPDGENGPFFQKRHVFNENRHNYVDFRELNLTQQFHVFVDTNFEKKVW